MINVIVNFILRKKMKKCKSVWRAMRRGHPIDFWTGTYRSRRETTRMLQIWAASAKKKDKEEDDGNKSE